MFEQTEIMPKCHGSPTLIIAVPLAVQATARGHGAADGAGGPADEPSLQHAGRRLRHHSVLLGQALHKQARPSPHPTNHLFVLRYFKSFKDKRKVFLSIDVR